MLVEFTSELFKTGERGAWTYAVMPNSAEFFKTKGLVKVRGSIDGLPFESSFMAMGDGVHMLPVKAELRKRIRKEVGDTVNVQVLERLG